MQHIQLLLCCRNKTIVAYVTVHHHGDSSNVACFTAVTVPCGSALSNLKHCITEIMNRLLYGAHNLLVPHSAKFLTV